ncbi:unnamed protein product [Wickerhamomyces anomalus]
MPRAIKGECYTLFGNHAKFSKFYLTFHVFQELDDTHLLIDQKKVDFVKAELNRMLAKNTYNPLDDEEAGS